MNEETKEMLNRISETCPVDDAGNICRHTDTETGKTILVSIPQD